MNLKQLKSPTEKAAPAPWVSIGVNLAKQPWPIEICANGNIEDMTTADIAFIAASRAAMPELISWVERAIKLIHGEIELGQCVCRDFNHYTEPCLYCEAKQL